MRYGLSTFPQLVGPKATQHEPADREHHQREITVPVVATVVYASEYVDIIP
jgi:hypothetical protein